MAPQSQGIETLHLPKYSLCGICANFHFLLWYCDLNVTQRTV